MTNNRIRIFDTTLRDGEQSPGCSMNLEEKLKVAAQLEALGVDIIEAGFAIASEGDFEAVQAVANMCDTAIVASLARAAAPDIERAWAALKGARNPRIHTFIATSDIHMAHKLRMDRAQVLATATDAVRQALNAELERLPDPLSEASVEARKAAIREICRRTSALPEP